MVPVLTCIYFAPSTIAYLSNHRSRKIIFFLNLYLGWTVIGWVVCFFWAVFVSRIKNELRHRSSNQIKRAAS